MHMNRKIMFAVWLLAGTAALTGCAVGTNLAEKAIPQAAQRQTAQPETSAPAPQEQAEAEMLTLSVDGKEAGEKALKENDALLLPLEATGEALGFHVKQEKTEDETKTRHEIVLEKDESRITVSYEVSDNTIRRISWQKDGLLIPVDTRIVKRDETVYVPAAFFEEAVKAKISEGENKVEVSSSLPMATAKTNQ